MRSDLQQLEQRWGLALESAAFGVWDLDIRANTVHYSPQWKALLGYGGSDEADSTATWRARVHPDDLQPMLVALQAHLAGSAPGYEAEFRLRAADGSYRWVLSRGRVAERDADGAPLRAVGTLTDLTDRREAERLRLERDRAQAASEAKTVFLSRMSHELRTPLNAVLGFAQLLAPRLGDADRLAEQQRYVAHIEQAGWQLLRMVDDVLQLSHIDSGGVRLTLEPVAVDAAVQRVLGSVQAQAQARGVQVQGPAESLHATVQAEPKRLHEVLEQLLGIAIGACRPGGRVEIRTELAAGVCTLSVLDTGSGMPAAQQAQLFEPFSRPGRAGLADEGGGIGLMLARSLLGLMGGTLAVQGPEGQGPRFTLSLPVAPLGARAHGQHGAPGL